MNSARSSNLMSQLLLIVGAVLVLLGLGSIAAGAPDWLLGLSMGATLIQSGTVALVGGLILAALGVLLNALQELTDKLGSVPVGQPTQSVPMLPDRAQVQRQPQAVEGRPARMREAPPPPEPPHDDPYGHAPEPHAEAEPPRVRRERPREPQAEPPRVRRPAPVQPAPSPAPVHEEPPLPRAADEAPGHYEEEPARSPRQTRSFEQANEELARIRSESAVSRREEQPRPRREGAPGPIPPLPQPFGKEERERRRPSAEASSPTPPEPYTPKFRPADTPPPPAPARAPAPAPSGPPASEQVVRSGVIGGMAYTLYADGSIEAELAIGTVRFDSISDLQDHVLRTGQEADADFEDQQR